MAARVGKIRSLIFQSFDEMLRNFSGPNSTAVIDRKERRIGKNALVSGVIVRAGRRARRLMEYPCRTYGVGGKKLLAKSPEGHREFENANTREKPDQTPVFRG